MVLTSFVGRRYAAAGIWSAHGLAAEAAFGLLEKPAQK